MDLNIVKVNIQSRKILSLNMCLQSASRQTERDHLWAPDVPDRPAARSPSLAGLDTLEIVVLLPLLLLVTRLLRPVDQVMLSHAEHEPFEMSRFHVVLARLELQQYPGSCERVEPDHVVSRVVYKHSVVEAGVKVEDELLRVGDLVRVEEGVTHPIVDCGHLAAPDCVVEERVLIVVQHDVLNAGGEVEGVLLDTARDL